MSRQITFAGAVLLTSALLVTAVLQASQQARTGQITGNPAAGTMKPAPPGPLPPIPIPGYAPARPMQTVHQAYEFAARHPEVLRYIPCYCGCERVGHGGNHDCFVRSRDSQGRVTWDEHGYSCTICIDVAYEASLMYNSGASVSAIRAAIDKKYGSRFPSHTPTPEPPKAAPKPAR
jgi:hypothetical protein